MTHPSLGALGEEYARTLVDAYELGSNLSIYVVTSEHATALAELRRRLAGIASELHDVVADATVVAKLYELVAAQARCPERPEGTDRPLIWISQSGFEDVRWREALALLNQHRESLRLDLDAMLIVAGPPSVTHLFGDNAPDFYANREGDRHLSEAPLEVASSVQSLRWLHLSDFHFSADQ
ncbi:MAG: hypothetical protein KAI47_22760, partial [Deltaproteobacteria bacterium]|nr:hypothetical protein [Deltaproteobacteria bacterium]